MVYVAHFVFDFIGVYPRSSAVNKSFLNLAKASPVGWATRKTDERSVIRRMKSSPSAQHCSCSLDIKHKILTIVEIVRRLNHA
jgi:hypothetical protein